MEWEFNWIDQNTHHYNSVEHIDSVKENIANRYRYTAILKKWRELKQRKSIW